MTNSRKFRSFRNFVEFVIFKIFLTLDGPSLQPYESILEILSMALRITVNYEAFVDFVTFQIFVTFGGAFLATK